MSKEVARRPESYEKEQFLMELTPELLRAKGFESVRVEKRRGMKFLVGTTAAGTPVAFWLKQGWSTTRVHSAIQFGMIAERSDPDSQPDSVFVDHVRASAASAKLRGAAYVLMVHMFESEIRDYVTLPIDDLVTAYRRQMRRWPLPIDDLVTAYRRQMRRWPKHARNTKMPTLYFVDLRDHPEAAPAEVVADLEVPLEAISGLRVDAARGADGAASRKITIEVERRLKQQTFRVRVGERYGWRCAVTGTAVRDALDAPTSRAETGAWRTSRATASCSGSLHRLLDRGVAEIRGDTFAIVDAARAGEYVEYDGRLILP
ncbi:MAG TPA: hypothetical protein VF006_28590 [Longimicrobium sp.]